jgi:hypothetical protein
VKVKSSSVSDDLLQGQGPLCTLAKTGNKINSLFIPLGNCCFSQKIIPLLSASRECTCCISEFLGSAKGIYLLVINKALVN